jgi:hypothetical protein
MNNKHSSGDNGKFKRGKFKLADKIFMSLSVINWLCVSFGALPFNYEWRVVHLILILLIFFYCYIYWVGLLLTIVLVIMKKMNIIVAALAIGSYLVFRFTGLSTVYRYAELIIRQ